MTRLMRRTAILITILLPIMAHGDPTPFRKAQASVAQACRAYTAYDRDRDGQCEIASIERPRGKGGPWEAAGRDRGTVLVLVEKRIWAPPAAGAADLRPAMRTFVRDLARDGYHAFTVVTDLYAGPRHQDGLTLLALRDFLRDVRKEAPDLKGAILVGNFPYPFLVRQYYWHRGEGPVTIHGGTKAEVHWDKVPWINSDAEPIVSPADIVLADLDGRWDQLYHREATRIGCFTAAFPDDPKSQEVTQYFDYHTQRYEDFFFLADGTWSEEALPGGKKRFTFAGEPNDECAESDRAAVNVIARPDIAVSRINAWHAGVEPDPAVKGVHGEGLLDAAGNPQTVQFASEKAVPRVTDIWKPSEKLERRLLVEYFARNHTFRTGGYSKYARPASISTEWESATPEMKAAIPVLKDADTTGVEFAGAKTTLADFVTWMENPAEYRKVSAHSNGMVSQFGPPPDPAKLDERVGPRIFYWSREGDKLVPTLRATGGDVEMGLLRSLYENKKLPDCGALYLHIGCEIMRPANAENVPYTSPEHGKWQLAEAFLMVGNGLAFVGRGKVFFDEPREFWETLGKGGNIGDAWRRYFDVEAADAALAKVGIDRKRTYFWSILGDFTLGVPELADRRAGRPARPRRATPRLPGSPAAGLPPDGGPGSRG